MAYLQRRRHVYVRTLIAAPGGLGNFELRGRRDMDYLRDREHGFGASVLALAPRQRTSEFLFETRHKLGAADRPSR